MSVETCRLCFEKKRRPISIFTGKGIKLNIAETIRTHFRDEVNENHDFLPKFVCSYCWTKLTEFHAFYIGVVEAKDIYLKTHVKLDEPSFVEVKCDLTCFDGIAVKEEPTKVEPKEESEHSESNSSDNDESQDAEEFISTDAHFMDVDPDEECKTEEGEAVTATSPSESSTNYKKSSKFDHVMADYIDVTCHVCGHPFQSLSEAKSHLRNKHKVRSLQLKCCQRKVILHEIDRHILSHSNPEIYRCDYCSKFFFVKSKLGSHLRSHKPKRYECDICKKRFVDMDHVRTHILGSHCPKPTERPHECTVCNKRFMKRDTLRHHVKHMHEAKNHHICHICAKAFTWKNDLERHVQKHSECEETRIYCNICGLTYKNEASLRTHMFNHEDEGKSFPCPKCPKICINRNALKGHIQLVHNYKTYPCDECDKVFRREILLKEHKASHMGVHLYQCAYCPTTFKSKIYKNKHCRNLHSDILSAIQLTNPNQTNIKID